MIGASIREAGCGLCCLAMMADRLTVQSLSLRRLVSLSRKHQANLHPGTDMEILGPVIAELLDLDYSVTNSVKTAVNCLKRGGSVIANTGGDREGYTGVFSHGGHFILLLSGTGRDVCVLDPSNKPGKYDEPGRERESENRRSFCLVQSRASRSGDRQQGSRLLPVFQEDPRVRPA